LFRLTAAIALSYDIPHDDADKHKYQLSLTNPLDALDHGKGTANKFIVAVLLPGCNFKCPFSRLQNIYIF